MRAQAWLMRSLVWFLVILGVVGFALVRCGLTPALAHRAPSGWAYDPECCHDMDCAPVTDAAIREVAGGYQVTIAPGAHPMVPAGAAAVAGFVAHVDRRIRASGDDRRHACISRAGTILCIYVQPGGV